MNQATEEIAMNQSPVKSTLPPIQTPSTPSSELLEIGSELNNQSPIPSTSALIKTPSTASSEPPKIGSKRILFDDVSSASKKP